MSRAAVSILVYSIYLIGQGLVLLVIPNVALGIFGLPSTQEVWVRILGYSLLAVSGYFLVAARREVTDIFRLSIVFRLALPVVFALLVIQGYATSALLLLAPADILFALWTGWALWSARPALVAARQ